MSATIPLAIITPTSSQTITIHQLDIESLKGQLTILPGHEPAYIVLKEGSSVHWVTATNNTKTEGSLLVNQAILEVQRDSITLITNTSPIK